MRRQKESTIMLAMLSVLVFLAKIVFNTLAGLGVTPFQQSVKNASETFHLDITPAGWAFSIWILIYIWNAAYIVYALTTSFRDIPPALNALFFLLYALCDLVNVAWLYAFTSNSVSGSSVVLIGNQVMLYIVLYVVYTNYIAYQKELETNYTSDSLCLRILVQNGIMLNAAWVTIASLLNITMVLVYEFDVTMPLSCCVALTLLLVITIVWFALENFKFQKYLNYTYADWPVVLWALSASLAKNWDPKNISMQYTLALLIITLILFIARITLQVVRNKKIYYQRSTLNEQFIHCSI